MDGDGKMDKKGNWKHVNVEGECRGKTGLSAVVSVAEIGHWNLFICLEHYWSVFVSETVQHISQGIWRGCITENTSSLIQMSFWEQRIMMLTKYVLKMAHVPYSVSS